MPDRLVVMSGTATEIGKTYVGAALARVLRTDGMTVAARKPAQSFEPGQGPLDAEVLAAATGEHPDEVCPPHRSYEVAMAPPMAAQVLARPPVLLDDLIAELRWPPNVDVGLVEGVGGPRSPIAIDGDTVDLAARLHPHVVVLVADAGLGTINAVRMSLAALGAFEVVVMLNRFDDGDDLHRRNREWLEKECEVVVTVEGLAQQLR